MPLRATFKQRLPWLVHVVRAARRVPGVSALRRIYADMFTGRIFSNIYRENMWGDAESRSGGGSNLAATAVIREELPGLVRELGVRSMLDVPCGDFRWMAEVDLDGVSYVGGDIVSELIAENQRRYGSPTRRFVRLDVSHDPLPRVDLILCRDLFIHLSLRRVQLALENFRSSGATWLAASTYVHCPTNVTALTGGYRPINLQAPPFDLPAPARLFCEEPQSKRGGAHVRYIGVWRIEDFPQWRAGRAEARALHAAHSPG